MGAQASELGCTCTMVITWDRLHSMQHNTCHVQTNNIDGSLNYQDWSQYIPELAWVVSDFFSSES